MKTIIYEEFKASLKAQCVPKEHYAFKCPLCKTVQSAHSLIKAGAGTSFDDVQMFLGFSCVGRFTGAGSPRNEPDGSPCNWTLGGLFRLHKVEILTPDGERHPHFEPASKDEAIALMEANGAAEVAHEQ